MSRALRTVAAAAVGTLLGVGAAVLVRRTWHESYRVSCEHCGWTDVFDDGGQVRPAALLHVQFECPAIPEALREAIAERLTDE